MFKTNDLYELISWLFLSLFWFGKTKQQLTALPDCVQNKKVPPDMAETKIHAFSQPAHAVKESGLCRNDVWFYSEVLALSRKTKSKLNERRRKEDSIEAATDIAKGR